MAFWWTIWAISCDLRRISNFLICPSENCMRHREYIYIYVLYTYIYVSSQANESTTFLGLTGLIDCVYLTQLIRRRHRRDKIKLSTVSCPQLASPRPNCRWHFQFWFLQYFYIHSIRGTTYSACNCCATLWGNTQRVFTTSMASRLMDSLST